ncbi:AAA family ATPase, partial [Buttiauxella sp. A2-C1_F]|uniref:AAA family ATPase n=1 Tax=Buttiauxella sp. A2-C1_F TaxID=2904526 RepID=UPI001E3D9BDB
FKTFSQFSRKGFKFLFVHNLPVSVVGVNISKTGRYTILITVSQTRPCFFDRGVPDVAGYLSLEELTIPRHLDNAIAKFRYNRTVFIAPPWRDIYVQDTERKQSFDVAVETYHAMVKAYRIYDYQLIELPCVSVEERVDFILSRILR